MAVISEREQRGALIAAVTKLNKKNGYWEVPSSTGKGKYIVEHDPVAPTCTCPDYELRGGICKHAFAVRYQISRETNSDGSETVTESMTLVKKTTYKQDWPAYNAAQSVEKDRFQELLSDLCQTIEEPPTKAQLAGLPSHRAGRKPHTFQDSIFAMAFKIYTTLSSRRFSSDLREAHKRGFLSKEIPGLKVSQFFENPAFTPILKELIVKSSLPLKAVDVDFAVDSSGFTGSKFVRWFSEKYGTTKQAHTWIKVHLICGVKTNVVTSAEILGQSAGDCPQLPELVRKTSENFTIREVSADKAYMSYENHETVAHFGGTGFIAFRGNATGKRGGMFERMFHFFQFKRDEFLSHYHKRSNVESTFSMIKRKFGDNVRSRTETAMTNEVLCKVLAHNLCCLIQEQHELGIEPVFWGEGKKEHAPVLQLIGSV